MEEGRGNRPGRAPAIPCAAPGETPKQAARLEGSGGRARDPIGSLVLPIAYSFTPADMSMKKPRRGGLLEGPVSVAVAAGPDEVVAD